MSLEWAFAPWLCWALPMAGSVIPLVIRRGGAKTKGVPVVVTTFLSLVMALLMLPSLSGNGYLDLQAFWFSIPNGGSVGIGMLVDPLSIIIVNIVAFLCFLIMLYSLKYVEGDASAGRYWFLMSLFIGGMLLLTLADNLILFFVGWKIVGLCSYGLIGYYYRDEREHWIGGPAPSAFMKPSRAGLKALLMTTFGDVSLLASILIIYLYSGTFNFMELYQTAGVWLAQMGGTPGVLTLTALLFIAGPLSKSAQFPFHEWLPDAMAGPTPVSALIHAATMVKAGVYLVARVLPIFFFAYWVAVPNYPEAMTFFIVAAVAGAITLFMSGTQALVALELKKVLAYSTISAIGYMMLALGVAGFSPDAFVLGMSSSIFHLICHGVYKASLFLCAGIAIHVSGSIYINEMKLSKRSMRLTWLAMWIAGLASVGVPPLSGFWSKEGILNACLDSGQIILFAVASLTAIITMFYVVRYMGLMFAGKGEEARGHESLRGTAGLLLIPPVILAAASIFIGVIGPWLAAFLEETFGGYITETLGMVGVYEATATSPISINPVLLLYSILLIVIGFALAYWIYFMKRVSAVAIIERHPALKVIHRFLWNRWYIDPILNKVFVSWTLAIRETIDRGIEGFMDRAINNGIPALFTAFSRQLRKIQTGVLSMNMLYFLLFVVAMLLVLLFMGVP
jgi:NADH-quinone oxidoreductase subunit L